MPEMMQAWIPDPGARVRLAHVPRPTMTAGQIKSAHVARLVPQLRQCVEGASFDVQIINSDDITFARL